ncbi:MAG: S-methyl-5'-thioinosine phosphorylase [Gammaproteobacteria bacterium]|jgi:5'-methylthioinosine phosphorylase
MSEIAIIGGTGLAKLPGLKIIRREVVHTPFGEASGAFTHGEYGGKEVVFLARHGYRHTIPPHIVNYRANLWGLRYIGVKRVIAITAVGGITPEMKPRHLVIPDQIIDYTWGRAHTFFEKDLSHVTHIDFSFPYDQDLRELLIRAAGQAQIEISTQGTYGATQGPRLETAAEITRMERDGCDIVGMTGMPEAALAREIGLAYASCSVVANWAAGRAGPGEVISIDEINQNVKTGMEQIGRLLSTALELM